MHITLGTASYRSVDTDCCCVAILLGKLCDNEIRNSVGILNHFIELIKLKCFSKVFKINSHLNNSILIIYNEEDLCYMCCNSPFLPETDFIQKMD